MKPIWETTGLPRMLERIRRCKACGKELMKPPLDYEEVPYCEEHIPASTEKTK